MSNKEYALIKDSIVSNVIVFDNPSEEMLELFKNEHSADNIIELNELVVVGSTYDGLTFFPPQPFPSWTKDEELKQWNPPTPYPQINQENPIFYVWNEELLNWEEVSE
jgi:hypothetical protein